jgi:hypothetical protein
VSADLKWAEPINAASKSRHDRARSSASFLEPPRTCAKTGIAGSSPAMTGWFGLWPVFLNASFLAEP